MSAFVSGSGATPFVGLGGAIGLEKCPVVNAVVNGRCRDGWTRAAASGVINCTLTSVHHVGR